MPSTKLTLAALLAATTALPVIAQEITPLTDYDATQIEGAWSADQMRDADVYGEDGEIIGYVRNIVVGSEDTVERILIETDNWLDLGDRMISVPWENVDLTPGTEGISAMLDEDEMDDFSLFADDEVADLESDAYRSSALLDSYVNLEGGVGYGYVTDLIFSQDGTLSSVLITPDASFGDDDYTGGFYAYPYYSDSTFGDPLEGVYTLPYTEDDVLDYTPYDASWTDESL